MTPPPPIIIIHYVSPIIYWVYSLFYEIHTTMTKRQSTFDNRIAYQGPLTYLFGWILPSCHGDRTVLKNAIALLSARHLCKLCPLMRTLCYSWKPGKNVGGFRVGLFCQTIISGVNNVEILTFVLNTQRRSILWAFLLRLLQIWTESK